MVSKPPVPLISAVDHNAFHLKILPFDSHISYVIFKR